MSCTVNISNQEVSIDTGQVWVAADHRHPGPCTFPPHGIPHPTPMGGLLLIGTTKIVHCSVLNQSFAVFFQAKYVSYSVAGWLGGKSCLPSSFPFSITFYFHFLFHSFPHFTFTFLSVIIGHDQLIKPNQINAHFDKVFDQVRVPYFPDFQDNPSSPATELQLEVQSKFIQVNWVQPT